MLRALRLKQIDGVLFIFLPVDGLGVLVALLLFLKPENDDFTIIKLEHLLQVHPAKTHFGVSQLVAHRLLLRRPLDLQLFLLVLLVVLLDDKFLVDEGCVKADDGALICLDVVLDLLCINVVANHIYGELVGGGGILIHQAERNAEVLVYGLGYSHNRFVGLAIRNKVLQVLRIKVTLVVGLAVRHAQLLEVAQKNYPVIEAGHDLHHQVARNHIPVAVLRHDQPVSPLHLRNCIIDRAAHNVIVDAGYGLGHHRVDIVPDYVVHHIAEHPREVVVGGLNDAQICDIGADGQQGRI